LPRADVVIAPTINYHFYPAFVEYPGSTHLRFDTARDLVVDIVVSLARHGPRRFYVLNTGVSTLRPLAAAAETLATRGILLRYTNILTAAGEAEARVRQQPAGTHADEIETSIMLYMNPERVEMRLARRDITALEGRGGLTRTPGGPGIYSPTGIWGDATLATPEKGRIVAEATLATILRDIEELRAAGIPAGPPR
jgi:creatinine amidohydrolase